MPEQNTTSSRPADKVCVAALYRFVDLPDYAELRQPLEAKLQEHTILGTVLLAREGINGTISGLEHDIDGFLDWLTASNELDADFTGLSVKKSWHAVRPFLRLKVKLKKEIVTMGVPTVDAAANAGTYVPPAEWNDLISAPDVVTIDTRNDYEVQIGQFRNAVNPGTTSFREFPAFAAELDPAEHPKVAMYCTGGIRCEKATAYMKELGFAEVYHLQGGILQYLADVPQEASLWEGECFVFDERVTVDHRLHAGSYTQCHACRAALTPAEVADERYIAGTQCPQCCTSTSPAQRERYAERERQMRLARERGEQHLGAGAAATRARRTALKRDRKATQRGRSG